MKKSYQYRAIFNRSHIIALSGDVSIINPIELSKFKAEITGGGIQGFIIQYCYYSERNNEMNYNW